MKKYLNRILFFFSLICLGLGYAFPAYAAANRFTTQPSDVYVGNVEYSDYILNGATIFRAYFYSTSLSPGGKYAVLQVREPTETWDEYTDPDIKYETYWSDGLKTGSMYCYIASPGAPAKYYVGHIGRIALWTGSGWTFSRDFSINGTINTAFENTQKAINSGDTGSKINVKIMGTFGTSFSYTSEIYENGKWNTIDSKTYTITSYSYRTVNLSLTRRFFIADNGKPVRITINCNGKNHVFNTNLNITYKEYNIIYDGNGGTPSKETRAIERYKPILEKAPAVTRSGYSFLGWYSSLTDTSPIPNTASSTYNRTIYAKWKDIQAPVCDRYTYVADKSGYYVYTYIRDNNKVNRVQYPTWTDYNGQDDIQLNWPTNSAATGTAGSWTINGKIYNNRYRVNISDHKNETGPYNTHIYAYDDDGNSQCVVSLGNIYIDNVAPIIDRKAFVIDQSGIDCYVHAYDPATRSSGLARLNIWVWNGNIGNYQTGKNFDMTTQGNYTINGQSYNYYYRVNKSDYNNFNTGYYSDARVYDNAGNYLDVWDGTGSGMNVLYNVGLTSRLTFDGNGGTINGSSVYSVDWVIGSNQTPPTPIRSGYSFNGWQNWTGVVPSSATTYKATWKASKLSVTLNLNKPIDSITNPSCSTSGITVEYQQKYNFIEALPTPALIDWEFSGWYTAASGGSLVTNDTIVNVTNNHTLYAHWKGCPPVIQSQDGNFEVIEYTGIAERDYLEQHGILKNGDKLLDYPYGTQTLLVKASGGQNKSGTTNVYSWYESEDGVKWNLIATGGMITYPDNTKYYIKTSQKNGFSCSELEISDVNRKHNNRIYKCLITNNAGQVTTEPMKMTVYWLPK
ncbi:InlB B-repeat-containing protein [Hungatella hathewayi]|uniref:InlB B-repeat-containing protein n=1 Tax=Hungatella hathewayi TaxID=154046 RepID=UPI00356574A8